ncbi:MAG: hypothetical protein HY064_09450 [Bacteroidetes bacterium]|nr:hypothetical protein [Bacteroidota bacterium]
MKKAIYLSLIIFTALSSCKKDKPIPLKVVYSVSEISSASPTYDIAFTSDKTGTTTISSSSSDHWSSPTLELDRGQFVSMKVDCTDPTFDIKFAIYINGYLFKNDEMQAPVSSKTISGNISN